MNKLTQLKFFNKVEAHRDWVVGLIVLIIVFIYLFAIVPNSGTQTQTIIVRLVALVFSGLIITTNILNVILLRTITDSEWGKLIKLRPHVWVGLILGFAIPVVSVFVAFGVVTISP